MAERPDIWMVVQDGCPIARGMRKDQAESHANRLAQGLHGHRAGTRIREVDITIARDTAAMQTRDALYTEFKGYRKGGEYTKVHRQWTGADLQGDRYGT